MTYTQRTWWTPMQTPCCCFSNCKPIWYLFSWFCGPRSLGAIHAPWLLQSFLLLFHGIPRTPGGRTLACLSLHLLLYAVRGGTCDNDWTRHQSILVISVWFYPSSPDPCHPYSVEHGLPFVDWATSYTSDCWPLPQWLLGHSHMFWALIASAYLAGRADRWSKFQWLGPFDSFHISIFSLISFL